MTTAKTQTMLSARGLMKSFGAVTAADNVNIEIPTGQRVSLIGSNGAGKTTFVNMVTGYLKPDAGTIELDGQSIAGLGPRRITGLGVARSFQIPQLALDMSALDNMLVAAACNDGHQSLWRPAHASSSPLSTRSPISTASRKSRSMCRAKSVLPATTPSCKWTAFCTSR